MLNKIQPSKFEDLIGFIQRFMNQAVSYLATRRTLQRAVQNGMFLLEEGWGNAAIRKRKVSIIFRPGHLFGGKGSAGV